MKRPIESEPDPTTLLSSGPALQTRRSAALIIIVGSQIGQRITVLQEPITIGRSPDCKFQIAHRSVSRTHCLVWREGSSYRIRDLQSTNKTYLNNSQVTEAELKDGDQITLGETIVKFIGPASVEGRYHDELYQRANFDSLTDLYNRRQFRVLLDRQIMRAVRRQHPLALAIIDLDHFKQINDFYGHEIGDQVLRRVAAILKTSVCQGRIAARIGGEEFGLVFPELGLTDAVRLSQALRVSIADELASIGAHRGGTASIGVAEWQPEMHNQSDLLRAADIQLYRAKALGRNQVCWQEST